MNEITRIHLARTPYEIDIEAKKALEHYTKAIKTSLADNADIYDDIELRMTEILADRRVVADNVITLDDINAIKSQLGEPSDFATEGADPTAAETDMIGDSSRKLYRDPDAALVGGVVAGIAHFFRIDPTWARLIFIVLLVLSFGSALLVYFVLWIIIPPARTTADKLRMNGQPVTLASIKALNDIEDAPLSEATKAARRVFHRITGVILLVGALAALGLTIFAGNELLWVWSTSDNSSIPNWHPVASFFLQAAFILFVLAGLLLTTLLSILANAALRVRWSRRTSVTVVGLIIAGLLSFAGGVGITAYNNWHGNIQFSDNQYKSLVNLPANFASVKQLTFTGNDDQMASVYLEYIVSDKQYYELEAWPDMPKPEFSIGDDGASATVELKSDESVAETPNYWANMNMTLRIYGPAIEKLTLDANIVSHYYSDTPLHDITIIGGKNAFSLGGSYTNVRVESSDVADIDLSFATIENLDVSLQGGEVRSGVVRTLNVERPDMCPAHESDNARLVVQAVSSGKLTLNKTELAAQTVRGDCGAVIISSVNQANN